MSLGYLAVGFPMVYRDSCVPVYRKYRTVSFREQSLLKKISKKRVFLVLKNTMVQICAMETRKGKKCSKLIRWFKTQNNRVAAPLYPPLCHWQYSLMYSGL